MPARRFAEGGRGKASAPRKTRADSNKARTGIGSPRSLSSPSVHAGGRKEGEGKNIEWGGKERIINRQLLTNSTSPSLTFGVSDVQIFVADFNEKGGFPKFVGKKKKRGGE